jgi:hypothetical protein
MAVTIASIVDGSGQLFLALWFAFVVGGWLLTIPRQ